MCFGFVKGGIWSSDDVIVSFDSVLAEQRGIHHMEKDFYGKGESVYVVERMNLTTGNSFEDGEHILYVNGEYRGESDIGKLMYNLGCTGADDMNFDLMAERTRYLKENPEGVSEMCKALEDMRNQAIMAERREIALTLVLKGGLSNEEIAEVTKLPLVEIEVLASNELRKSVQV